jgi:hypothetical protein
MEIAEVADHMVWMTRSPVEKSEFEALEVDASYTKSGVGPASMDRAGFRHSPDRPDEPVREREIGGHQFINVAAPAGGETTNGASGADDRLRQQGARPRLQGGSSSGDPEDTEGDFVEVVGDASNDAELLLPEGGELSEIVLTDHWVVPLPTPTRVFFWWQGAVRSFQGPVMLPSSK